jgi:hypothetical protein
MTGERSLPDPPDEFGGPDHDTRDREGRVWAEGDCPACGAPAGDEHGCTLAERSAADAELHDAGLREWARRTAARLPPFTAAEVEWAGAMAARLDAHIARKAEPQ